MTALQNMHRLYAESWYDDNQCTGLFRFCADTCASRISAGERTSAADQDHSYESLVKETIDYESLEVTHHDDMRQVDENVNLIVETVMCKNDKILIASNWYPASLVKKKFLMLTYSHIEYVLHCMRGNTTKVKNIKKYLLAALFNAPSTMNGYYQAEVNHDMPGLVR